MLRSTSLALVFTCLSTAALAQMTPVGTWHTVDDTTQEVKSEVVITEAAGVLSGKITKFLKKDAKQDAVCDACKDARKGQPLLGLEIIQGASQTKDRMVWEGGRILDPESGTEYKLKLTPVEGGKRLEVRGFVGFALLGRTQTWVRVQ